tara:strand:- start:1768 stop:1986 length:219 start_codon:yes stop_codon:yes gene_type:complete
MYTLIIIATFLCSDNTTVDKEEHFKQSEYAKAVERMNKLLGDKGKAEEYFNGKQCILEDVRAGHRKNEARTR